MSATGLHRFASLCVPVRRHVISAQKFRGSKMLFEVVVLESTAEGIQLRRANRGHAAPASTHADGVMALVSVLWEARTTAWI